MDVNSYSYVNSRSGSNTIAEYDDLEKAIVFEIVCNYFQERYYLVSNLLGDEIDCFNINDYEAAARFYNSLVPDNEAIPLF